VFQVGIHHIYLEDHKNKWSYKKEEEAQMIMIEIRDRTTDTTTIPEITAGINTMTMEEEETTIITAETTMEEDIGIEEIITTAIIATTTTIEDSITTTIEITITEKMTTKMTEVDLDLTKGSIVKKEGNPSIHWVDKLHNSKTSNQLRCLNSLCKLHQICRQLLWFKILRSNIESNSNISKRSNSNK
jgi:hypothetical protein